jgi:hypothetical protein
MEKSFHRFKDFFDEAILQGWTMLKQYEIEEHSVPIKFQIWGTPKTDKIYLIQIWPNDFVFVFEHIENFKFIPDGKNAKNKA